MKKSLVVFAVLSLAFFPQKAFSWADEGHAIVALTAQQILTDQSPKDPKAAKALATVQSILGQTGFDKAALWPDDIKNISRSCSTPPFLKDPNWGKDPYKGKSSQLCDAYAYTSSWHFINSDTSSYAIDPTRTDYFKGDVVVVTQGLSHLLKGEAAPVMKGVISYDNWKKACLSRPDHATNSCKKEAVEFLMHLVGDIHQPLHTGSSCDLGSNLQEITFFGQDNDPHAFWCAAKKPKAATDTKAAKDYAICLHHELHQTWDQNLLVLAPQTRYKDPKSYAALLIKEMASVKESSDPARCVMTAPDKSVSIDDPNGPLAWANESLCYQPQAYQFPDDATAIAGKKAGGRSIAQATIPNRCRTDKMVKSVDDQGHVIQVRGADRIDYFTPFAIGPKYYATNIKTIDERLYWGGVRLANLLKEIYGEGDKAPAFETP